jgi:hypothetical protein
MAGLEALIMNPKRKHRKHKKAKKGSAAMKRRMAKVRTAKKHPKKVRKHVRKHVKHVKRHAKKYHRKPLKITLMKVGTKKHRVINKRKEKVILSRKPRFKKAVKLGKVHKGEKYMINPKHYRRHHRRYHRKNPAMNTNTILNYVAGAGIAIVLPKVTLKILSYVPFIAGIANTAKANLIGRLVLRAGTAYAGKLVEKKTKFKLAGKAMMYTSIGLIAYELANKFLKLDTKIPMLSFVGLGDVGEMGDMGRVEQLGDMGDIEMAGIEQTMGNVEMEGIQPLDGFGAGSDDYMVQ